GPVDAVAVTGTLGRAAAGLALLEGGRMAGDAWQDELTTAHLRPIARVAEGVWLGARSDVHAMIDCSDGLATDLGHVCRESGVGARVMLEHLPVGPALRAASQELGPDAIAWAVGGGAGSEV